MKQKIKDFFAGAWRKIRSVRWRLKGGPRSPRKRFRKEKPLKVDYKPEMEAITDQLIRETVGRSGSMEQEFQRRTAQFSKEHPIGETEARELLMSMLKLASANRDLINGRIINSVESGSLNYRYYSKMKAIYKLTVETNHKREKMAAAQRDYYFAYNLYNNVRDLSYSKEVLGRNDGETYAPPPPANVMGGGKTI